MKRDSWLIAGKPSYNSLRINCLQAKGLPAFVLRLYPHVTIHLLGRDDYTVIDENQPKPSGDVVNGSHSQDFGSDDL